MNQQSDEDPTFRWGRDDSDAQILHVDMDAFFAAVELIDYPEYRGQPVVVGGQQRGVVLAATYEARAFGVRSAMPMKQAMALAPQAVILPPNHHKYRRVSAAVMDILTDITPVVEQISIDEAFLDVSGARRRLGRAVQIATLIRQRIVGELDVIASVGIGGSKFVAKLASSHAKPDGILLIPQDATIPFLHSLHVRNLWGVGERTEATLANAGIRDIVQLAHTPITQLEALLGKSAGRKLHELAWGRDPRPVEVVRQEKSIGHEQTFPINLTETEALEAVLLDQAHRCAARLRAARMVSAVVSIKVRMADFTTLTRSGTQDNPTDVAHDIYHAALGLLTHVIIPSTGVRLLGVRCEALSDVETTVIQPFLDDDTGPERREAERVMDEVHAKFGEKAMRAGTLLRPPATGNPRTGIS